jgi:hypothetical protein
MLGVTECAMRAIRLSAHARDQALRRGATEEEIARAIREARWASADYGRLEVRKTFPYDAEWNKRRYRFKCVRPIFVLEDDAVVVVTVYTYYCDEEGRP